MVNEQKGKYSGAQVAIGGVLGNPMAAIYMTAMNAPLKLGVRILLFCLGVATFIALNLLLPVESNAAAMFGNAVILVAILFVNYLVSEKIQNIPLPAGSWLKVFMICICAQVGGVILLAFL